MDRVAGKGWPVGSQPGPSLAHARHPPSRAWVAAQRSARDPTIPMRALDPELVWLAHEHEPWRPRSV
jgi:hypothetical protein